jgi:hypothetical protein
MPELAVALSPRGTRVQREGDAVRLGRKGSLKIFYNGFWNDYEADEWGRGPGSLIAHMRPGIEPVELRVYVLDWLKAHLGTGSGNGGAEDDAAIAAAERTRLARNAGICTQVLGEIAPAHNNPGGLNLTRRGLGGVAWPVSTVGYVTDDERPGEGALVGVITDESGKPAGIQLGYLDHEGRKVEVGGTTRRQFLLDRNATGLRFHVKPADMDEALPLLVCEGLENTLSLALAYPSAEVFGVPGIGRMRRLPPFKGRDVVVFRDGDSKDSSADRTLISGVDQLQLGGARVKVTVTPPGADANSVLQEGGIAAVRALVDSAEPARLSLRGVIRLCAAMPRLDYLQKRKEHAKAAGIPAGTLDQEVEGERARIRRRSEFGEDGEGGSADDGIYPDPVNDIAAVLDAAREEVARYVVADPVQLDMAVMWALHTHFVHHAVIKLPISPRLAITAPSPECGKTTLMEGVSELTARPEEVSSFSAAAFFRISDAERPTWAVDEIQGILNRRNNEELSQILLASHRRRWAWVPRVVPDEENPKKFVSKKFSSWGTFVCTLSGPMSYAMQSRCLVVTMRKARPGEVKDHLQDGHSPVLAECSRKFARWASDQLTLPDTVLPAELHNRTGDNWRPLFRVAAQVAGHWATKVEAAAMVAIGRPAPSHVLISFLTDSKPFVDEKANQSVRLDQFFTTTELVTALTALPEPTWDWNAAYRRGPINAYWLRDNLLSALAPPGTRKVKYPDGKTRNVLHPEQFTDPYSRYVERDNSSEQVFEPTDPIDEDFYTYTPSCDSSGTSGTTSENSSRNQQSSTVPDQSHESVTSSGTGGRGATGSEDTSVPHDDTHRAQSSVTGHNHSKSKDKTGAVPDVPDQMREGAIDKEISAAGPPTSQSGGEEIDELW